ncbi:ran-binding protein 3a [Chanos chanos]|uniref:Ran-binding protein 3 n=1 Tax=Chanos chanos TaxID=29144 RepID=A0A6J2W4L7_CHACN|nr:ran-binding protein 3 [Chanos chanos]
MADLANEEKPAIAPPVFVFQKDKAQKRSADGSSAEDGEDSDKEDGGYCPAAKRERTSAFPPSHSVSKNVFMVSGFSQSPTGNSDSEPEEKTVGFRLKPPTLIHGQAPSAGVPSQKPKEQQRSVLRPAVLQAPPTKTFSLCSGNNGTNGVKVSEGLSDNTESISQENTKSPVSRQRKDQDGKTEEKTEGQSLSLNSSFVFGQNIKDRVKVDDRCESENKGRISPSVESNSGETNYFLQYINNNSSQKSVNAADAGSKFVFGQNMSDRVLSPPKCSESSPENSREPVGGTAACSDGSSAQNATSEKDVGVTESLEESAAAYTKATAKRCLLDKVEVRTGEESERNVLQMQCKLFVFEKSSQSWVERGRGLLRLNDMASTEDGTLQSRLVMRTQGSLRLILNTKLWTQMQVDKASEKSIRITAMDTEDQGLKVFLISASSKDTGQLFAALHHRILALRSRAESEPEPNAAPPGREVSQSNEGDSEDEEASRSPSAAAAPATPAPGNSEGGESQPAGST